MQEFRKHQLAPVFAAGQGNVNQRNRLILVFRNRNIVEAVRQFFAFVIAVVVIAGVNHGVRRLVRQRDCRAGNAGGGDAFELKAQEIDRQQRLLLGQAHLFRLDRQIQPERFRERAVFARPCDVAGFPPDFFDQQFRLKIAVRAGQSFFLNPRFQIAERDHRRRHAFALAVNHMAFDGDVMQQLAGKLLLLAGMRLERPACALIRLFADLRDVIAVRDAVAFIDAAGGFFQRECLFADLVFGRDGHAGKRLLGDVFDVDDHEIDREFERGLLRSGAVRKIHFIRGGKFFLPRHDKLLFSRRDHEEDGLKISGVIGEQGRGGGLRVGRRRLFGRRRRFRLRRCRSFGRQHHAERIFGKNGRLFHRLKPAIQHVPGQRDVIS